MATADDRTPEASPTRRTQQSLHVTLRGWKEIAAHLGRGVRTVQRWEKEAGLPIRRVGTGRGEAVFALVDEIDAWINTPAAARELTSSEQAAPVEPAVPPGPASQARSRRIRPWLVAVAALCVLVAAATLVVALRRARPGTADQPWDLKIERNTLFAFSRDGRPLWTYPFPVAVDAGEYDAAKRSGEVVRAIADIDGDGQTEVLVLSLAVAWARERKLYCLNSDGTLRFVHTPQRAVRYDVLSCAPPYRAFRVRVAADASGRKWIWFVSNYQDEFPTVVEKLDAWGTPAGEFWNPGQINEIEAARIDGRPVMLAGGVSNEFRTATLAVLDAAHPTGTAPATAAHYTCTGCPPGQPADYLVFPAVEANRFPGQLTARVQSVRQDDRGTLTVVVRHFPPWYAGPSSNDYGEAYYYFDSRLKLLLGAEVEPSLKFLHQLLFKRGFVDHEFGADDERAIWPVRRWNGRAFEELAPRPAAAAR